MARKPIVDIDLVLQMLQEGRSTRDVADHFSVSRQAIDLHRKRFISQGLLQQKRAGRAPKTINKPPKPLSLTKGYSLEELIDLVLEAFTALKRMPALEADLERYKHDYETALSEIERLKQAEEKRTDQESRWLLAQQQNSQPATD